MDRVYRQDKRIFLSGSITTETAGEVIYHFLNIIAEDDAREASQVGYKRDPIKFFIQSSGGNVSGAFGISDVILNSSTPVDTYGVGNLASAAVALFLSGTNRFLYKNTEVMLHAVSRNINGTMQDLLDTTEATLLIQERFEEHISSRTTIGLDRLRNIRKNKENWYMFPEEALKFGIATSII